MRGPSIRVFWRWLLWGVVLAVPLALGLALWWRYGLEVMLSNAAAYCF